MKEGYFIKIARFFMQISVILGLIAFILYYTTDLINITRIIFYIVATTTGIFLLFTFLSFITNIKRIDFDYFRNIMIGIAGGLTVWVVTKFNFNSSHGFWLSVNEIITTLLWGLAIIFAGYFICRNKKEQEK